MHSMQARSYESIDKIDEKEWDSIVGSDDLLHSYAYLKAVEYSKINDFRYHYFMIYQDGKLKAHSQVGILTFGIDAMVTKWLKSVFDSIRKVFPRFLQATFVESGFSSALGNALLIDDPSLTEEILDLYDRELSKLAKAEKASFILIRDIYAFEKSAYDFLLKKKYCCFPNLPNTFLDLGDYGSFEEYLQDLHTKRRREIKSRLAAFRKKGCTIREVRDFADMAETVRLLWHETYLRAKEGQREILNREYFAFISEFLKDRAFLLLCEQGDRPIGFTMLLDSGDTLISTYCGLDYETNKSCFTYFILFYKSVEKAIESKKRRLEIGVSSYTPKIEIGAIPEPMYVYGTSNSAILRWFFKLFIKCSNISPKFEDRTIFNEKHYSRPRKRARVVAENGEYELADAGPDSIAIEGEKPLRGGRVALAVFRTEDSAILGDFRVLESAPKEGGGHRIVLACEGMEAEYLLSWKELLKRFAAQDRISGRAPSDRSESEEES